jgi:TetR/AcrR family transcriptional repressor of nem operon
MGRPRSFDTAQVLASARDAFVSDGYNGTSIDNLLRATGLQRASLYQAFGSKRGLFVTILREAPSGQVDLDLLLVALMDLSAMDPEVRELAQVRIDTLGPGAAQQIGRRLLARGTTSLSHTAEEEH